MTPSQYRRAPIPAYGRTIEAMRLALLDTPEGRAMINAGDTRLYWMNESDTYMPMSPFGIESPFINTTAPDAVARLVEAARAGLNYLENTEGEFGITLGSATSLRAALAAMEASHDHT
jgi:hypothetical protein